jgi:hypothetical protein
VNESRLGVDEDEIFRELLHREHFRQRGFPNAAVAHEQEKFPIRGLEGVSMQDNEVGAASSNQS